MFPYKDMEKLDSEVEELANKLLEHEKTIAEIEEYLDKIIEKLDNIKDRKILTMLLAGIINQLCESTRLSIATIIGIIETVKLEIWKKTTMLNPIVSSTMHNYLYYKKNNK